MNQAHEQAVPALDEPRIEGLLDRWEDLRERGEVLSAAALLEREHVVLPVRDQRLLEDRIAALQCVERWIHDPHAPSAVAEPPAAERRCPFVAGSEPIPGYRLVEPLGTGGFGYVWKATAPGDIPIAMKFVPLRGGTASRELRALEIIKNIRHANLVCSFGAWHQDGWLIVAMELADRTLMDRLRETRTAGLPGIPRDELLAYMEAAADALDFLNAPQPAGPNGSSARPGIQHRDVKPQNLLLVQRNVKLGDFGLACALDEGHAMHSGRLSVAFAAPEFFDNKASQHSDQYSLAVTYTYLRGGRLPFEGSDFEMMRGHVGETPNLDMLPAEERPVVARALAKDPSERWPSCREFVAALEAARVNCGDDAPPIAHTPGRKRGKARWLIAACAVLLPAGVVAATWPIWGPIFRFPISAGNVPVENGAAIANSVPFVPLPNADGEEAAAEFQPYKERFRGLAVSGDGRWAVTGDVDGRIHLWDVPARREVSRQKPHDRTVNCVAITRDGRLALSGSYEGSVAIFDVPRRTVQTRFLVKVPCDIRGIGFVPGTNHCVVAARIGEDRGILAVYDFTSGDELRRSSWNGAIFCLAISPDGQRAVTGGWDGKVVLWNLETGDSRVVGEHKGLVECVAFVDGGDRIFSGGADGLVHEWKSHTGEQVRTLRGHAVDVTGLAVSSDGQRLVTGSFDGVRYWDRQAGTVLHHFGEAPNGSQYVTLMPDGSGILSVGGDQAPWFWAVPAKPRVP
jgi:WD40 repeat protein